MGKFSDIFERLSQADTLVSDSTSVRDFRHAVGYGIDKFTYLQDHIKTSGQTRPALLDFGCGSSAHRKFIETTGYKYTGVDLEDTTGYSGQRVHDDVVTYDGGVLPFGDAAFDVVYSSQVFEHVDDPFFAMSECRRMLKNDGAFIGSVSFLEPYHAYQTFSYTPHGFNKVALRSGFELVGVSPAADGLFWLLRKLAILSSQDPPAADEAGLEALFEKSLSRMSEQQRAVFLLNTCATFSFYFKAV